MQGEPAAPRFVREREPVEPPLRRYQVGRRGEGFERWRRHVAARCERDAVDYYLDRLAPPGTPPWLVDCWQMRT